VLQRLFVLLALLPKSSGLHVCVCAMGRRAAAEGLQHRCCRSPPEVASEQKTVQTPEKTRIVEKSPMSALMHLG